MLGAVPGFISIGHRAVGVDMARTTAVTQFADRVLGIAVFLMRPGFVIVRVTACAIGLESRILPINNLGVRPVTLGTWEVATVILWLVGQGHVAVIRGRPGVARVADIALLRGAKVIPVGTSCRHAIVAG